MGVCVRGKVLYHMEFEVIEFLQVPLNDGKAVEVREPTTPHPHRSFDR